MALGKSAPSGANMMLKAFGIDPTQIGGFIDQIKKDAGATVQHFDMRLQAIETRVSAMEVKIDAILAALAEKGQPLGHTGNSSGNDSD